MSEFLKDLKKVSPVLFNEEVGTFWFRLRLWIALKLLPKDLLLFFSIVITKLRLEYDKLDTDQINKITSLKIDFEYRE